MKSKFVQSITGLSLSIAIILSAGCAAFKPTPSGGCPQVTQTVAESAAYLGSLAAIKKGAPKSVLTGIASNIDASVASGQFDSTAISAAIAKAGGGVWAESLGGIEILFGTAWQSSLDSNLSANVCTLPILEDASLGIKLAVTLSARPASFKLAPVSVK